MRRINIIANYALSTLAKWPVITVAIAPPRTMDTESRVYIVPSTHETPTSKLIDANPAWLVGVFNDKIGRIALIEAIMERCAEIERAT